MMLKFLSLLFAAASAEEAVQAVEAAPDMALMTKGLIVTGAGLAGVFLVLLLFFFTIKLMQKMIR